MSTRTRVANGTRIFPKPHEWAGDRPALGVASYPVMLRFVARQLIQKGCWLAGPLEEVAKDWDGDTVANAGKLQEVLAHGELLTDAQISRVKAAIRCLQERT